MSIGKLQNQELMLAEKQDRILAAEEKSALWHKMVAERSVRIIELEQKIFVAEGRVKELEKLRSEEVSEHDITKSYLDKEEAKNSDLQSKLSASEERVKQAEADLESEKAFTHKAIKIKQCEILVLESSNLAMRRVLDAVDKWYGLDGDGISEPVRAQVKQTLSSPSSPNSIEVAIRDVVDKANALFNTFENTTISHPEHWHEVVARLNNAINLLRALGTKEGV